MPPIRYVRIAALALAGVALAGAASFAFAAGDEPESAPREEQPSPRAVRTIPPDYLASLYTVETSEYQAAILADGTITDEEMDAAVQALVACLRADGLNAEYLPRGQASSPPSYRIVSGDAPERTAERVVPCEATFTDDLGLPYSHELEKRFAAFSKEEAVRRVEECIESRGFFLEDKTQYYGVEFESTPEAGKAVTQCLMKVKREQFPQ